MDKSSYDYNIVDFEDEVWFGILGYDGYMVSNYGRVNLILNGIKNIIY